MNHTTLIRPRLGPSLRGLTRLSVTSSTSASLLDLSTNQNNLKVASVNEQSNSKSGYKVTITSLNLSKLKRMNGLDLFAYTMTYDQQIINLSSISGTTINNVATSPVNIDKDVFISYTGSTAESMAEGSYTDTVTFTIAAP